MRRILLIVFGALGGGCMLLALVFYCAACRAAAYSQSKACEKLFFPLEIPGTSLVAENLVRYDGAFLEDSSGREVCDTAALMLRNTGKTGILQAEVELLLGGERFVFYATQIPPTASILVLEKDGQCLPEAEISGCSGWAQECSFGWETEGYIRKEDVGMGSVEITNVTDFPMENICIYYKTEYAEGGFYLGGITHMFTIESLTPQQTLRVNPEYYASGSSKILRIEFEKKEEVSSRELSSLYRYRTLDKKS